MQEPAPPQLTALLAENVVEHRFRSMDALMADPTSTGADLIGFGKAADDARRQCYLDKQAIPGILNPAPVPSRRRFLRWLEPDS